MELLMTGNVLQFPASSSHESGSSWPYEATVPIESLRVLAIAHACEPNRGSEPGIGWRMVSCLSADHRVDVITEAQHRRAIEEHMATTPNENLHFVFVDVPFWKPDDITHRSHPRMLDFVYYSVWEVAALVAAWRACQRQRFNVIHHITFANVMLPPLAALLPGAFVWGPIGPIEGMPWAFLKGERVGVIARDLIRRLALWGFLNVSPTGLLARRRASALLFKTTTAAAALRRSPSGFHAVVHDALERPIAYAPETTGDATVRPLRVLTVSRFDAHKGVIYAVSGFAHFLQKGGQGMLTVIGDGPERHRLLEEVDRLRVQSSVEFLGYVPQSRVLEEMSQADVLFHPSFRDGLASAPLEALGASVPVVCQRRSGMLDIIDETCGMLVEAGTPGELSEGFGEALMMLYQQPQLRARLRSGALKRREELSARSSMGTLRAAYRHAAANG
jgi:glycosyltransferase involved in cell wall biosynthesis